MKAGDKPGGKIATPIREMLKSDLYNGVAFQCVDEEHAETTRIAALTLRLRNNYEYKTTRNQNVMTVYKDGYEYEPMVFNVALEKKNI